jgi:hypothetical protein
MASSARRWYKTQLMSEQLVPTCLVHLMTGRAERCVLAEGVHVETHTNLAFCTRPQKSRLCTGLFDAKTDIPSYTSAMKPVCASAETLLIQAIQSSSRLGVACMESGGLLTIATTDFSFLQGLYSMHRQSEGTLFAYRRFQQLWQCKSQRSVACTSVSPLFYPGLEEF